MSWKEKHATRLVKNAAGHLIEIAHDNDRCHLLLDRFADASLCLRLVDADNAETVARATVCVPDQPPPEHCVYVKDYSENAGILQALCQSGVVTDTGDRLQIGHAELAVVELSPLLEQQFRDWSQGQSRTA